MCATKFCGSTGNWHFGRFHSPLKSLQEKLGGCCLQTRCRVPLCVCRRNSNQSSYQLPSVGGGELARPCRYRTGATLAIWLFSSVNANRTGLARGWYLRSRFTVPLPVGSRNMNEMRSQMPSVEGEKLARSSRNRTDLEKFRGSGSETYSP